MSAPNPSPEFERASMELLAASLVRFVFGLSGTVSLPRLSTLMFHRVHAVRDELFPQELDAARFERLVRFVAKSFQVMTLGDAVYKLTINALPTRSLVITFDDGYCDNAEIALPILKRYGLTATFFVSTGFLDGGRMWNDSVIECIRACPLREIDLDSFGLGRCSIDGDEARREVIEKLLPIIKYLDLTGRDIAIARLQNCSGVTRLPDDLMMSTDQVRLLHDSGMEIGAHTVHHPILASLSEHDAENEIASGKNRLQEIIGAPVDVFAYPNGRPNRDYNAAHVEMLKRLGFKAAVSTAHGVARAGDDLFQLPRFTPWDTSMLKWTARLLMNQRNIRYDRTTAQSSEK